MPTLDEHFDAFFDNTNAALEEWKKFETQTAQIPKEFLAVNKAVPFSCKQIQKGGKETAYVNLDLSIYSNLDAAIEQAGQTLEKYMLAIHEMKAAFDKAVQLMMTEENLSQRAADLFEKKELVEKTVSQAVAATGVWEKGLGTVMPAYRKFKLLSTKQ
jgi:hypothetical protein